MNDKYKLLPCPFCGSDEARLLLPTCTEDSKYNPADRAFPSVFCIGCFMSIPGRDWDHSGNSAIAAWNRRTEQVRETEPVVTDEMVEALQRIQETAMRDRLFCDLKTDEEKAAFFLSGRGYESGVIAHSIQNDVAMAYHRCSEYRKEIEALQAENDRLKRYYKNGIECFANPCERHSGERTPPFPEFFERYGGQCLICVVDNNNALQAECEELRKDAERIEWLEEQTKKSRTGISFD